MATGLAVVTGTGQGCAGRFGRERGGLRRCHDVRVGPEREQESLEPGRFADGEHDLPRAVLELRSRTRGGSSPRPTRRWCEPQRDPRVVGREADRPGRVSSVRAVHRVEVLTGRADGPHPVDAEQPLGRRRWHHAARYQAPNAWNTRHGSTTRVVISSRANE